TGAAAANTTATVSSEIPVRLSTSHRPMLRSYGVAGVAASGGIPRRPDRRRCVRRVPRTRGRRQSSATRGQSCGLERQKAALQSSAPSLRFPDRAGGVRGQGTVHRYPRARTAALLLTHQRSCEPERSGSRDPLLPRTVTAPSKTPVRDRLGASAVIAAQPLSAG